MTSSLPIRSATPGLDESITAAQPLTNKPPITIAVDPVALVVTECITVTSAMRKHARWAHSSVAAILGGAPANHGQQEKSSDPLTRVRGGPQAIGERSASPNSSVPASPNPEKQAIAASGISVKRPRRNVEDESAKWAMRGKQGKILPDNPLMSAFTKLRSDLRHCKDLNTFDTPALLHPFLQVIRSSSTSASITSLALIAVTKFLSYGIINRQSPRLSQAMQLLAGTLTHTRFEASNTSADEIVFLRVLKLMEGMISGPGGDFLSDESMCQIMETALRLCCEARITQMLQRSAEMSMVSMCQVVFERLKHLELQAGDAPGALDQVTEADMDKVKMETSINGTDLDSGDTASIGSSTVHVTDTEATIETTSSSSEKPLDPGQSSLDLTSNTTDKDAIIKPYSLPSIKELFRTLVELLDPHDLHYTDTMRVMALRMVDVALEVAGPSIANHPSLASLAKDTLCRHLFQLVRSENMAILNESLRVAGTLLATCRSVLKLQQELFLAYLIACLFPRVDVPQELGIDPKLYEDIPQAPSLVKPQAQPQSNGSSSGRSTPVPVKDRQKLGLEGGSRKPDAREAMVESIGALTRMPSFIAELFVNYDCDVDRSDVCSDMIGLLARNAFPDAATWSTANVPPLCLDALLGVVQSIVDRLEDEPYLDDLPSVEHLRAQRLLKKVIIRGAAKFNESPKAGIAFLGSQGVIKDLDDSAEVAAFLRSTSRIDKKVLGDFLSKKTNGAILNGFLNSFDFTDQRVDEALRQLLHSFRLPGESQLIERIITEFAEKYCANGHPEGVVDKDAVYVLTYAIIMLNTDQHNPNMKQRRMTIEDFSRNLRGVNGGKDFAPEYLQGIYDAIKSREIILPEEHNNKHAYDHAWKELLVKVQSASDLVICRTNLYDAEIFSAMWRPIVATLSYVFMQATDDAVYQRVFAGFEQCAQIAFKYDQHEVIDRIVFALSSISTLAPEVFPDTSLNTEVQVQDTPVMVSRTAVVFGRDYKAQVATVVLFLRVLAGHEPCIKEGWDHVVRVVLNLFINSLIPDPFSSVSHTLKLPAIPMQPPAQVIDKERRDEGGLFSTLSSYVSSFTSGDTEPSDQEIDETQCAFECIQACDIKGFFVRLSQLPVETLKHVVTALLAHLPEDPEPRVISVKPEAPQASARTNGTRSRPTSAKYDPKLVFILEFVTILTLRDKETVRVLGRDVAGALQTVVRSAGNVHSLVMSRVVYYLLALLKAGEDHDFLRVPILLHTFSSFDGDLLNQCAQPLLDGMSAALSHSPSLRSEMSTSPDFWAILRSMHNQPKAASVVFQMLQDLVTNEQAGVTADNYEQTIALLNDFATAGSVGATEEARRGRPVRGKPQQADKAAAQTAPTKPNERVVRGTKAMTMLWQLTSRVPALIQQSHLEATEAWSAYWLPILQALTTQCLNPCREIRNQAMASLQRVLLSPDLASADHQEWTSIFGDVLFPLIQQLLKPEVYRTDPVGMAESRVQAATLLCRIFLHYLVLLTEWEGMLDLWSRILAVMDRLMNSGQGDSLEEAIPESLKNILLVMSSGDYLVPPSKNTAKDEFKSKLWTETSTRLSRFLPDLLDELFPEEVSRKPTSRTSNVGSRSQPQQQRQNSAPQSPKESAAGQAENIKEKENAREGQRTEVEVEKVKNETAPSAS